MFFQVDRSIIGGIVVDIQDKHIDLSIDTKIKQMEKLLAELVWAGSSTVIFRVSLLPSRSTDHYCLTITGIFFTWMRGLLDIWMEVNKAASPFDLKYILFTRSILHFPSFSRREYMTILSARCLAKSTWCEISIDEHIYFQSFILTRNLNWM